MRKRKAGSITRRLYLVGVAQLLLIGATVVLIGFATMPRPGRFRSDGPSPRMPHHFPIVPPVLTLVCGLVVLGLNALVAHRTIVRPLLTLASHARSFGRGDLAARANLRRNDELGELSDAFDEMAERIRDLVLAQRDLLANVSHELRTPLSRIRVALEVAADANDKVPALLGEIAIDLGEVEQILTDIVTTARLDVASAPLTSLPLHVERIAIDAVCQHAVERFHAQYPDRRLEVSVPRSLGFINVDPVLFRRVLDNVLENAAKYSPEASLVCLRAQTDNDRALLVVSDCGSGITAEDLPHVFEPFFRGERSRSRSAGGVGLGLTLAKRIVDAHGGSIQVASNKAGTTVTVIVASAPP